MVVMDVSLIMIYRAMVINYGAVDLTQAADMLLPSVAVEDEDETILRVGENKAHLHNTMLHPLPIKILCFTGFSTNISWLAVASIVNVVLAIGTEGWRKSYTVLLGDSPNVLLGDSPNGTTAIVQKTIYVNGSEDFAIMAVCLVALIACVLSVRNCDIPYGLVAIWALGGVYRAQGNQAPKGYPEQAMSKPIEDWAGAMMVVVTIAVVIGLAKASFETVRAYSTDEEHDPMKKTHLGSGTFAENGWGSPPNSPLR